MHYSDKQSCRRAISVYGGDFVMTTDVKQEQHNNTNTDCTIHVQCDFGEVLCVVVLQKYFGPLLYHSLASFKITFYQASNNDNSIEL